MHDSGRRRRAKADTKTEVVVAGWLWNDGKGGGGSSVRWLAMQVRGLVMTVPWFVVVCGGGVVSLWWRQGSCGELVMVHDGAAARCGWLDDNTIWVMRVCGGGDFVMAASYEEVGDGSVV